MAQFIPVQARILLSPCSEQSSSTSSDRTAFGRAPLERLRKTRKPLPLRARRVSPLESVVVLFRQEQKVPEARLVRLRHLDRHWT